MSQLDLIAELRANRPVAPAEVRERVRQLAPNAPVAGRRVTWRRALVVAIAVAALATVAGVLGTRGQRSGTEQHDVIRALVPLTPSPKSSAAGAAPNAVGAADSAERERSPAPFRAQKVL